MDGGTFGIIGFGRVGRAVVEKARSFNMEVITYDPYLPDDVVSGMEVEQVSLNELLERADCVSVHAPYTAETEGMLSSNEFARMNNTAVLVNTARGPIVDTNALVTAIEDGEIYAAGLDVFPDEPPTGSPVLDCDRIVCSPHHAEICEEAEEEIYRKGTEEIIRVLEGDHPRFVVNPSVYQYPDGMQLLNPKKGPYDYT
jgi:D-3-phosphoglycerate dehydrogenase